MKSIQSLLRDMAFEIFRIVDLKLELEYTRQLLYLTFNTSFPTTHACECSNIKDKVAMTKKHFPGDIHSKSG